MMGSTPHKKGNFYIGTSNVTIPGNKSTFPPEHQSGTRLHYYASLFNAVEINSSFYKIPRAQTLEKWTHEVGKDFRFCLKLHRDITHVKDLKYDPELLSTFIDATAAIGEHKGCLLIQFPGKIGFSYFSQVEDLLARLSDLSLAEGWRKVVEFRHPDWYTGETIEMLNEFDAAMVIHDIPKSRQEELTTSADTVYMRFHGIKGDYRDTYPDKHLQSKAAEIKNWMNQGRDVYAFFNNTIGAAFENARTLSNLVEKLSPI